MRAAILSLLTLGLFLLSRPAVSETVSECRVQSGGKTFELHRPIIHSHQFAEVWELLNQTRSGQRIVKGYNALRATKKQWALGFLQSDAWRQQGLPPTTAAMALAHEEPVQIFLKANSTLAVLAIYLVHEGTHAMDDELRANYRQNLRLQEQATQAQEAIREQVARKARVEVDELLLPHYSDADLAALSRAVEPLKRHTNRSTFTAERKAYDAQYEFIEELEKLSPCVAPYLQALDEANLVLSYNPSDEEIRATYKLD